MLIAQVVVIVGDHLVWFALEAHALVATAAGHPVASVDAHHWNLTIFVRTLPNTVFLHVFLEQLVAAKLRLLARQSRMVSHLN